MNQYTASAVKRVRAKGSAMKMKAAARLAGPQQPQGRLFPLEVTIPRPDRSTMAWSGAPQRFDDIALASIGRMNMCGLRWDHNVLDIGCGAGRMARYLCDYLRRDATYDGFDIDEDIVRWCSDNITPLFPNFKFRFVPVYNSRYAADPSLPSAAEVAFPYPDDSFDFAFAHSVYTHLVPDVAANYLEQTCRVLRPGGVTYSTWLLFDDEDPSDFSRPWFERGHRDPSGTYMVRSREVPDEAIAYHVTFVREMFESSGLEILDPIHPGFKALGEAIVARKPPSGSG